MRGIEGRLAAASLTDERRPRAAIDPWIVCLDGGCYSKAMESLAAYSGLFAAAFLSATVLPFQSEVVLVGLLLTDRFPPWLLLLVASAGNTLGAVVNWICGRFVARFSGRSWFPVSPEKMAQAEAFYRRYGRWSLLLSWVPFGGDALTVVAGVLRESLPIFIALVAIAKTARYLAIWALVSG